MKGSYCKSINDRFDEMLSQELIRVIGRRWLEESRTHTNCSIRKPETLAASIGENLKCSSKPEP